MNLSKFTLGLVVALAIAAAVYEWNRSQKTEVSLQALTKDRDYLEQQVESLGKLMLAAKEREAQAARVVAVPVVTPTSAKVTVIPKDEVLPPGVTNKAPQGWAKNGNKTNSYVVGVDQNEMFNGQPSAYVRSLDSSVDGFGGMMQSVSAEDYLGKRVKLSGWMKTEDANEGGGHLWLRVDGQQVDASLQFDNMNNRAPKGTTDWQQYSVVLDVPADSKALAYGFFVQGGGKLWVNSTKVEPVGDDVPSTNMVTSRARQLPKAPVNPSFNP